MHVGERTSGRLRARLAASAAPSRRDFSNLSNLVPDIFLKYTILPFAASRADQGLQGLTRHRSIPSCLQRAIMPSTICP